MNELVRKSLMIAISTSLFVVSAGQVMASGNCDSYAKLTLQQAKQNVDRRCGFKGARWSLDAGKHRKWCKEVGPSQWRAELKARNDMLAGCRG